ncbi:MAG: transposase [Proteobacteria bacterium]|nr:transposase [Pseudomonadota bacterium]
MKRRISITCDFDLAIGKVNLNEIVYKLKELKDSLVLLILKQILMSYDDLIMDRLTQTQIYPSKMRKGLGRHVRKDDAEERFCRGRKVYRRGHRNRKIKTVFGCLDMEVRRAECLTCGARYSPLLNALQVTPYSRKETNVEHEVTEAVIDTNYRRLIEGRSIDISLGGIHNIVVGSDIDKTFQDRIPAEDLSGIMADGTGVKQHKGSKGELRTIIGISQQGRVVPLGSFVNTSWSEIDNAIRARIKETADHSIPFVYDGEPGLDDFLSGVAEAQRCTWHAPRGLYYALWEDGLKKKESQPPIDKVKQLVGIELPAGDFEILKEEDKEPVRTRYETSKKEVRELISTFYEKGYQKGASYLESLSKRLFTNIELWLSTGIIAPKTTSLLERVFREIGRRLKRIAWGWSDAAVTNLSKMILIKQYAKDKWEQYWKEKLGIKGYFNINIQTVGINLCPTF